MLLRALSCLAFVFALAALPASAAGTLDQSQTEVSGFRSLPFGDVSNPDPNVALAQTFTAGVTGDLDQVDLFLGQFIADGSTAGSFWSRSERSLPASRQQLCSPVQGSPRRPYDHSSSLDG